MSAQVYTVTLKGLWSRYDTSPRDLRQWRGIIRRDAERRGFDKLVIHAFKTDSYDKAGTFTAVVSIFGPPGAVWNGNSQRALKKRAKDQLMYVVKDSTCRAPTVEVVTATVES